MVFEYALVVHGDALLVRLIGGAGFEHLAKLSLCIKEVEAAFKPRVIVDLSSLLFVSSAALGGLLSLKKTVEFRGGVLCLAAPAAHVRDTLIKSGLSTVLRIFDTVESAST